MTDGTAGREGRRLKTFTGAEVLRQQRRRCFLSLHFLFKDLTQHQE